MAACRLTARKLDPALLFSGTGDRRNPRRRAARGWAATSRKRNELVGLPAGRIKYGQFQVRDRTLVPMLDPSQHSRQILNDRLLAVEYGQHGTPPCRGKPASETVDANQERCFQRLSTRSLRHDKSRFLSTHVRQTWSPDREARRDVNCFTGSQGLRRPH